MLLCQPHGCLCRYFIVANDNTLRKWDIDGIKEEKVIDLDENESGASGNYMPCMLLVNGDKWVACYSLTNLAIFDLEIGMYMKQIDLQLDEEYDFSTSEFAWNFLCSYVLYNLNFSWLDCQNYTE